jgi:hypothetical protein
MPPGLRTNQVRDGEIKRNDLNTTEAGFAVVRRILAGQGITLTWTGADSGTGDVTVQQLSVVPVVRPPSGRIITANNNFAAAATVALAANTLLAIPIFLDGLTTFTAIVSEVTTLLAGSNFRMGVYFSNTANNYPTNLISGSDVGLISGATTGVKTSAFGTSLAAGTYWLVFNSSAAITMRALPATSYRSIAHGAANAVGLAQATVYTSAAAFAALPATFPAGATAAAPANIPTMGLVQQ